MISVDTVEEQLLKELEGQQDVDSVPDDAMPVEHDVDSENYVRFASTNLLEWYTVYDDDRIVRELFISTTTA